MSRHQVFLRSIALVAGLGAAVPMATGQDDEVPTAELTPEAEDSAPEAKRIVELLAQQPLPPGAVRVDILKTNTNPPSGDHRSVLFQSLGVGMFAASATDVATTEWGLHRGYEEGNPLARSRSIRLTHHVVGPTVVWYASDRLHRSGKRKLAWSLRIALMVAYSYATIHNARRIE